MKSSWTLGWLGCVLLLLALINVSCGVLSHLENICNCSPLLPDLSDYRHAAKHVPIPSGTPMEITVGTILSWPQTPVLPPTQPRFGRELQLVQVQLAYLQNASVNPGDCDIHLEISQVADRKAPRVIIETPVDGEYCASRRYIQSQLKKQGFRLDTRAMAGIWFSPFPSVSWDCHSRILNIPSNGERRRLQRFGRFILPSSRSCDNASEGFHGLKSSGQTYGCKLFGHWEWLLAPTGVSPAK